MEDKATLTELLFHAEQFSSRVESAVADASPLPVQEAEELRLKVAQCRTLIAVLQEAFEQDELRIQNSSVRANVRTLIMTLLWVAFYARHAINFRLFRMLVLIESSFTYLLNVRR